ncbi:hypothetical protein RIF29_09480 [Crotalaria pallida]|uniref:Uncharacterized protein n=1 Tax=Crotalaria pallida TaxID=3830 RepID=A0AAN9FRX8_CROPI
MHEDASERSEPIPMDLQALEDADLENLSPKKTQEILVCLDALRAKLTGKGSDEAAKDGNTTKEDPKDSQGEKGNNDSNGTVPTQEPFKLLRKPLRTFNSLYFSKIDKREAEIRDMIEDV